MGVFNLEEIATQQHGGDTGVSPFLHDAEWVDLAKEFPTDLATVLQVVF